MVSTAATGTITQNTISTLTFSSIMNKLMLYNNTGSPLWVRLNKPILFVYPSLADEFDFYLLDGTELRIPEKQIIINIISVFSSVATFTLPDTKLVAKGWLL